jgi:hypothetical protein
MKLPLLSRCFRHTLDAKNSDDKTFVSSSSSIRSVDYLIAPKCSSPGRIRRSIGRKSMSCMRLMEPKNSPETPLEIASCQDGSAKHSLLKTSKESFRSFRVNNKKDYAADARKALSLDAGEISPVKKKSKTNKNEFSSDRSVMDESTSGHSILDELWMEEYVDPYKEFMKKLERKQGVVEEAEIDLLTQLPAISMNSSERYITKKGHRRNSLHHAPKSSRPVFETRSISCIDFNANKAIKSEANIKNGTASSSRAPRRSTAIGVAHSTDDLRKQKSYSTTSQTTENAETSENVLKLPNRRPKLSKMSSLADLSGRSSYSPYDKLLGNIEQCIDRYEKENEFKRVAVRKPRKKASSQRSLSSGGYHGRLEL